MDLSVTVRGYNSSNDLLDTHQTIASVNAGTDYTVSVVKQNIHRWTYDIGAGEVDGIGNSSTFTAPLENLGVEENWNELFNIGSLTYSNNKYYTGDDGGYINIERDGNTVTVSMKRNPNCKNVRDYEGQPSEMNYTDSYAQQFCPGHDSLLNDGSNDRVTPYRYGARPFAPIPITSNPGSGSLSMKWMNNDDLGISSINSMGPSPFYINWGDNSNTTFTLNTAHGGESSASSNSLFAFTDWENNQWPQYFAMGQSKFTGTGHQHGGSRIGATGSGREDPANGTNVAEGMYEGTFQGKNFMNTYPAYGESWSLGDAMLGYTPMCAPSLAYILANSPIPPTTGQYWTSDARNQAHAFGPYGTNPSYFANGYWNGPDYKQIQRHVGFYFEGLVPPAERSGYASPGYVPDSDPDDSSYNPGIDGDAASAWDDNGFDADDPGTRDHPDQTYENIMPKPELYNYHGNLMLDPTDGIYKATHTYSGAGEFRLSILYRDLGIAQQTFYRNRNFYKHVVFLPRFVEKVGKAYTQSVSEITPHLYRGIIIE